jgi:tyrosine-specific transport protein
MADKKFFLALAVLMGTIVGAGIFGLPFVISKSGVIPALFYFFILGLAVLLLHLMFGETVLRTEGKMRLSGYSQKYLGKNGKLMVTISTFIGITGSLLAYIILGGNFLKIIFSSLINLSAFQFGLIFWAILVYFIFKGLRVIAPAAVFTNIAFFIIIFIVISFLLPEFRFNNLSLANRENIFLPYGIIMFSLTGFAAIPEIAGILKSQEERKIFKKVIIVASLVSIILYLIFSLGVIGVSNGKTSEEAFSGLVPFLGKKIITLGALFGVITIADSFLIICLYFRNTLIYDYHFPKILASFTSSFLPLLLFLRFRNFTQVVSFAGTILGTIEGIIILLLFKKAKKLGNRTPEYSLNIPNYLIYIMMAIFILGMFFQLFYSKNL